MKLPEEDPEAPEAFESEDGSLRSELPVESPRIRIEGGRSVFGADVFLGAGEFFFGDDSSAEYARLRAKKFEKIGDDSSAEYARLTATDEGEGVPCDGGMGEAAAECVRRGVMGQGIVRRYGSVAMRPRVL